MRASEKVNIIAAVRTQEEFDKALISNVNIIFDLSPDLLVLENRIKRSHGKDKKLFIHIDLASGIGKDKSGITYVKELGVDGIISTRVNIIKLARELGLFTVQRFFVVDSQSVDTTIEAVKASKADMIEIMPGVVGKAITVLKKKVDCPIIAGGLIESLDEIKKSIDCGAAAVSTGKFELWQEA